MELHQVLASREGVEAVHVLGDEEEASPRERTRLSSSTRAWWAGLGLASRTFWMRQAYQAQTFSGSRA